MSRRTFTRRSFVKAASAAGLGVAFVSTPVAAAMRIADAMRIGDRRYKYSETRFLMGTYVAITVLHESKDAAEQGASEAFEEIARLASILDRHRAGTPVSHLNETGLLTDLNPELREVLEMSQTFYRRSNGAFDSTVLPVVDMLRANSDPKRKLSLNRSDLDDALALVGSEAMKVSEREVRFDKSGMGITLDGIGKGYIVDCASDLLAEKGFPDHLINAGGDIRARGERTKGQPWIVAIEDPAKKGNYPAVIRLKDAAVATSGGYEVYFDAEHTYHHVVNPRTALSPRQSVSVSVTAPTVMEADALSTSAFVMPVKNGILFVNGQKNNECLIVDKSGAKFSSLNWETLLRV